MRKDEFPIVDKLVKDSINDVLDKIRGEIEQEYTKFRNRSDMWYERACGLGTALEIIDKYRVDWNKEKKHDDLHLRNTT